ncbi:hypothetical protein BT96DRAFT_996486 [Gymnopus androsaceus JB14]|uniref:Uncharacterized protein n=1 Tax=Gymnopus androsaceus JB14 TaxID=1447944 RepID=A0A6A4HE76_9AGAR|nr:hypothetical protein BT96DRAFT_996486 [Gymnopus androsaceus JB14]
MTRSSQTKYSPQATKKAWKRTCLAAGMSHSDAVIVSCSSIPGKKVSATDRRNPGRMDGVRWNADSFICPENVDGFESYDDSSDSEEEVYDDAMSGDSRQREQAAHVVSLLDIAKPAKPKGIAKDFEVVKGVRRVIFLEDEKDWETFSQEQVDEEWEEWEEIYESTALKKKPESKPSYSDILTNKR